MLEPIVKTIEVPCSQKEAFSVFVENMGTWWPMDRFSISAKMGGAAKSLRVETKLGGKIVEIGPDDAEHHWGTFRSYDPYGSFGMDFHMGLPACESRVNVTFAVVEEERTRVVLTHGNWEAYGDMAEMMFGGYCHGWPAIFENAFMAACGGEPTADAPASPECAS